MRRRLIVVGVALILAAVTAAELRAAALGDLGEGARTVVDRVLRSIWRWAAMSIGLVVTLGLFLPFGPAVWVTAAVLGVTALGHVTDAWTALRSLGVPIPELGGNGEDAEPDPCVVGPYVDSQGILRGCVEYEAETFE